MALDQPASHSGRYSILPSCALDDNRLEDRSIVVLALLGSYADADGWCWPSYATMSNRLGWSKRTIIRQIALLVRCGYLEVMSRNRPNKSDMSNKYRMCYPNLDARFNRTYGIPLIGESVPEMSQGIVTLPSGTPIVKKHKSPSIWRFAHALAVVCNMHFEANKGRLLKDAKDILLLPGADERVLLELYGNNPSSMWCVHDWRGRKGETPSPSVIKQTWQELYDKGKEQMDEYRKVDN